MLAELVRSGLVETVHDGAVAVVDARGRLVASSGDLDRPFFFRSAAKPFQATVSQELGAGLGPRQMALACASHDGEPVHLGLVEGMLTEVGLEESDLGCPPAWPLSTAATVRLAGAGYGSPRRLWNNCSGKHAAMLRAASAQGWPIVGYTDPAHPVQETVSRMMRDVTGGLAEPGGVDGCGVPVFTTTARTMAGAFARLAVDERFTEARQAMHRYPALVSGSGNHDALIGTWLHAVAKRGAAGCLGVAISGQLGMAVKCWDGSGAAAGVAALDALRRLGWFSGGARDALEAARRPPVLGGGRAVGELRSALELS